uniref:Uncharacterized protein n=1 Tax=Ditylenchus dipsaci TaxID=166011 RepID=A0A915CPP3_9BILA
MVAAQALANALAAAGHSSPGMGGVVPATMPVMSTDTNGSSASSSTSSRKRNAQTAGFDELGMPSSSSVGRNPSTSTVASSLAPAMQSGLSVTTSAAQSAADSANTASLLQNLQALRQSQMLFATAAANNGVMPQIKRSDKNMVPSTTAQIPMYAAAQPVTQFNPYLQQIPAGYLPTVSFNGAIPPRF